MRIFDKILIKPYSSMEIQVGDKYQWIKGPNFGDMEIVAEIRAEKLIFESGRPLMKNVVAEFVKKIESDKDAVIVQKAGEILPTQQTPSTATALKTTPAAQPEPAKDAELTISKNKIENAIKNSKKEARLEFNVNMKFLDISLYDFLKDNHESFDEVYKELLFEQLKSHMTKELNKFISNTYPKN